MSSKSPGTKMTPFTASRPRQNSDGDLKPITPKHQPSRFPAPGSSSLNRDEIVFAPFKAGTPSKSHGQTTHGTPSGNKKAAKSSHSKKDDMDEIMFNPASLSTTKGTLKEKKGGKYEINPPSLTQETTIVFDPTAARVQHQKKKQQQQQAPQLKQDTTIYFDPKSHPAQLKPQTTILFDPNNYRSKTKKERPKLDPQTTIVFDPNSRNKGGRQAGQIATPAGASIPNKGVGPTKSGRNKFVQSTQVDDKLRGPPDIDFVAQQQPPYSGGYLPQETDGVPTQIIGDVNPVPLEEQITECTFATFTGNNNPDDEYPNHGDGGLLGDSHDEHLLPSPPPQPPISTTKLLFQPNEATIEEDEDEDVVTAASSVIKKQTAPVTSTTTFTPLVDTIESNGNENNNGGYHPHDHRRLHADYSTRRHENQTAVGSTIPLTPAVANGTKPPLKQDREEDQQQLQEKDEFSDIPKGYFEPSLLQSSTRPSATPADIPHAAVTTDEDEYEKFFKMLDVGVPMRLVKQRMESEGYDRTYLDNFKYRRVKWKQDLVVRRDDIWDGEHAKYYKMLSVGVPLEGVKRQMIFDGEPPSSLDLEKYKNAKKRAIAATRNDNSESINDERYTEYFNLLSVGLALKDVKQHMKEDGLEPDILDDYQYKRIRDDDDKSGAGNFPNTFSTEHQLFSDVQGGVGESLKQGDEEVEESEYSKYFKLIKVGIPLHTVKATLQQDGLDPTILDTYAMNQSRSANTSSLDVDKPSATLKVEETPPRFKPFADIPDGIPSSAKYEAGASLPTADTHTEIHEDQYEKYFKMLGAGVQLRAVRNRMEHEGFDPNDLDNFQYERVRWKQSILYQPTREEEEISRGEHAKYYKMLSAGVPLAAVQQRLELEGWDPYVLDLDLYNKAKARERAGARADYEGGGKDLEYSKYFQLLSNGVILRDVKKKMEQDGADPEILEMYQYKRIHISEEDMVLRGEHAKYFQMLDAGVPVGAVYQRMKINGLDPSELDVDLYERVKAKGNVKTLLNDPLPSLQET